MTLELHHTNTKHHDFDINMNISPSGPNTCLIYFEHFIVAGL